jgi:hypothetical protein|tara:strand:- start:292 stop:492 length:201 start_codon:yes stop_codon:yes gene_type:complete
MTEKNKETLYMIVAFLLSMNLLFMWFGWDEVLQDEPKIECTYHGHEITAEELEEFEDEMLSPIAPQ